MSTVDNRIIHMTFDNGKFERDIANSIKSLDQLKTAMDFKNVSKTFSDLSKATQLKLSVNTSAFENGLAEAHRGAQKLQDTLNFGASAKTFGEFSSQVKSFNLEGMTQSIGGVSKKFLALATIGITALAQIAAQAARTGIDMVTSLTSDPIIQGFQEMETNMNSIQTILANTASKGTTLDEVNDALKQLNEYSDQTIYNFSQMARNIGTFTAAGVDLDTSVGAIKGIANLAAVSGSSSEQASTAMYQLSQALATGTLKLMDWNSVVNAGMGGEVFKNALFETGKALGQLGDIPMDQTFEEWEKSGNNFRESLQDGWITSEVLTTALQAFTGDLTKAQLINLGYTEEQAIEMEKLGTLAQNAATEVKTLTQLLGTVKESIGSGWAQSFQIIFGDFEEAKATFTDFNNIIGEWVGKNADARNKVLGDWKALGGRTLIIEKIKDLFANLNEIIDQVQFAFHDIFPRLTGERLFEITERFGELVDKLDLGREGLNRVARYASAFFTAIDIGLEIVKRFGEFVGDMVQHFSGGGAGGVVDFIDKLARVVQNLYNTLVASGGIDQFFDSLTDKIIKFDEAFRADPSGTIKEIAGNLGSAIGQLFDSLVFGDFHGGYLAEDSPLVTFIFKIRDKLKEGIDSIGEILGHLQDFINEVLGTNFDIKIPDSIKNLFTSFTENVDNNTTNSLAGGFERVKGYVENIRDALDKAKDVTSEMWDVVQKMGDAFKWIWDTGETVFDVIKDVLGEIWDFAKEIGPTLQDAFMSDEFDRFLDLMDSLGVLLGGRGLQQFGSNTSNIGANFGANIGANFGGKGIEALTKGGGIIEALKTNLGTLTETLKTMQTQIRANALLDIAKALALLTASVLVLSFINPESLAKSLTALAVGMSQLLGAVALLNLSSGKGGLTPGFGLIGITVAMNGIATAILILSAALTVLAQLSPSELANGLLAMETLIIEMATVAALLKGSSASLISGGIAMIAMSTALVILGGALKIFATMSWEEIGKGITTLTGTLLILSAAMASMAFRSAIVGPSLIAVATALVIIGAALKIFATMSWEEIGKGMTTLVGTMLVLSAAMSSMPVLSAVTGPALIAVATALVILGGALKIFASMSWEEIGKAMTVLTGGLLILSAALASMQGAIPGALALGVAAVSLIIFGKALKGFADMNWKTVGKGLLVMATALGVLAGAALVIQPAIPAMLGLSLALLALGAGFALIGVGAALLGEALQIVAAAGTAGIDVFMYAVDQFLVRVPELIKVFTDGLILIAQSIVDALPAMVTGFGKIIAALLKVIIDNIPEIVVVITKFIQGMLKVIRDSVPDFVRTGFAILMGLLHGIEDNITEITDTVSNIIERFLRELAAHVPDLIAAGVGLLVALIEGIADGIPDILEAGVDILENLLLGIAQNIDDVADAVGEIITRFITEVGELYGDIIQAGVDALIEFVSGLAEDVPEIARNVGYMVTNIIDALADEFVAAVDRTAKIIIDFLNDLAEVIRENDDEMSDAMANLGAAIIEGIIVGLVASAPKLVEKVGELMADAVEAAGKPWEWFSPSHVMMRMGNDIIEGLIIGLDDRSPMLNRTAGDVSAEAVNIFQKTLSDASYGMERMSEFNPTITPVLDLTQVRATAGEIGGMFGGGTLTPGVSIDQAKALATAAAQAREDATESDQEPKVRDITYQQINNSPQQLNTATIYKQTKSLIRVTEKELENA